MSDLEISDVVIWGCRDIVILVYSEYLPWNGIFGYVCFWGVHFCLFWTMGNPGKFMVCYLFVIFLHAYFVVPYFVVLRYCGIGGSIVGDFVSMVIMIMMIMMIAIPRSRDLGCHDVTMSRSRDVTKS